MVSNFEYIKTTAGKLKLVTIVMATIALALSLLGHFDSEYTRNRESLRHLFLREELRSLWREYYLMGVAAVCLVVSIANLIAHLISKGLYWDRRTAIYDFLFHSVSCLLLGSGGILFVVSAVKIFEINCTTENKCQHFDIKIAAGGLSLVTAVIYGAVGAVVLTNRKDVERDALIDEK